ncbi:MAG: tRNA (adenosine(37)-N6)-threonylcarbamoyltransferase complex dimerization subunit type 1 TsaB [Lachnospiraceae bacterium]|nr:tRNA (adenosine(37)-N6)-threonylcarbamoyltransferase complex dimerization subunit type 1 TsaB [Lachnospiraceae bacterium]
MVLAIDSSSLVASVALADEDVIIAEYTVNLKKTHSQTLLPMIDEIFRMTEIDKKEVEAIVVSSGPGSFTGLRIGAATAKGLALALDIPVVGISTIEMMANNYNHCNKLICPIMDARRNQVYTGIYSCEGDKLEEILKPAPMAIEDLLDEIIKLGKDVIFVGDGIPAFKSAIQDTLESGYYFGRQNFARQNAGSLASLGIDALKEGKAVISDLFAPEYMRLSQAERERLNNGKKDENK